MNDFNLDEPSKQVKTNNINTLEKEKYLYGQESFPRLGHLYGTLKGMCKLNGESSFPVT